MGGAHDAAHQETRSLEKQIEKLLDLPDGQARRRYLETHRTLWCDDIAAALKDHADQLLRVDVRRSLAVASLLCDLGDVAGRPRYRALGLLVRANAFSIGLGDYAEARTLYDEAAALYHGLGLEVEAARAQVGKVWPLACLGLYDEAVEAGAWAGRVLEAGGQWASLATLTMNMAAIHGRQGEDVAALEMLDRARQIHHRLNAEGTPVLAFIAQNRAIVLRNLGRFEESMAASQEAWEALITLGQTVEAARARQNLAITYVVLGRYNRALQLLNEARDVFWADGRQRDAILVDLFVSDCLLMLRRFAEVLERTREVRDLFRDLGTRFEVAQSLLNEAVAYAGLHRYDEARASLAEARRRFAAEENEVWVAASDLELAAILLQQGCAAECPALLAACSQVFRRHGLPLREAQVQLVAARVEAVRGEHRRAAELARRAVDLGEAKGLASLTYEGYHLLGRLAEAQGDRRVALEAYERAIADLEQLRGRLMVEFRVSFLEDKATVYEDAVGLCLDTGQAHRGLEFAERGKSRALLDLLAYRLDLGVRARTEGDAPLVARLEALRAERDRLYRRWQTREPAPVRGGGPAVQGEVLALEKQITQLWHQLLIRNHDYARDAALWQVRTEPVQPYLDAGTLLIEYFTVHGRLVAFLVDGGGVEARRLPGDLGQIERWVRLFWLNLRTVPHSAPDRVAALADNAGRLLRDLHTLLIAPLGDALAGHERLIVVPHGPLHYLPFHALHDGEVHLLERHEISYLPGASVLRYCTESRPPAPIEGLAAFGYSWQGRLRHTVAEAQQVAGRLDGVAYLEEEATLARLRSVLDRCRVLHLATHGDFRPDNPLFSGLVLADGWLTTLDVFNLRLAASLVTLSACQTGRSVVGGGDELMGLMRAFLYAGSASLLLTLWPVEDRSAAEIIDTFYGRLAAGWSKAAALRFAQRQALAQEHPYYWAPFYLVGDPGPL